MSDTHGEEPRLPAELEETVARVLGAARLTGSVRRDVEGDLRAHFVDGLAAGRTPAELLERFGDPDEAGRKIGRARGGHPGLAGRGAGPGRDGDDADTRHGRWTMTGRELWAEVKGATRSLLRSPGFAGIVVATLALGVGANTAVFTVLDAALLAPLPYEEPGELVRVYETSEEDGFTSVNYLRGPGAVAYREWDDVFESFGVLYTYQETGADLTDGDRPERVVASIADAGFFEVMGVPPLVGRTFREEETVGTGEEPGRDAASAVAVLSHDLWQRRFGGDPAAVGRTIRLDGASFEVVGVMPPSFTNPFGSPPDLWLPQDLRLGGRNSWGNHYLSGVARLRDGVTAGAARRRVDALMARLVEAEPEAEGWGMQLVPLREDVVGESRRTMLWVLAAAVALVLLSACVNVGNLVFARNLGRGRELAVRGALGSGRGRLIVHLLAESGILAVAGGVAGAAVGWLGIRGLLTLAPDALPALVTPELSGRLFLVALAVTGAALALFGLVPALRFSRTSPAGALRAGGRGGTEERGLRRLRNGLVVTQIAVAVVLVVGAGLLARSFTALRAVDLSIEQEGVLTFEVHLPRIRYPDGAARHAFHEAFQDRVAALPGVEAVGAVSWLPVNGRFNIWGMGLDPGRLDDLDTWRSTDIRVVAGDWFGAMGIDVVRGAGIEAVDPAGPPVVWVNRRLVEEIFGGAEVVGRAVQVGSATRTIVGVVEDVPHSSRGAVAPKTYIPHAHFADDRNWTLFQTVRARPGADLGALREAVGEVLRGTDPNLVLHRPRPFADLLARVRAEDRFATTLMSVFALLALALSAVGTYGVLANAVARRRREIGIRMALGADAGRVRGMVVGSALAMTGVGAVAGLAAAWAGGRWLESLLFGVEPGDPAVLVGAVLVLASFAALAAWVPARRATRVDPARALAAE